MPDKEVVVLGVGVTKFSRDPGNVVNMAREAGLMALKDAGVKPMDIEMGFCAHCNQMLGTGMMVFNELGIYQIPVTNVECACASASRGALLGANMIVAGAADLILVVGVERMPRGLVPMVGELPDPKDMPVEFVLGLMPMPGAYALMARRHMGLYGTTAEHWAKCAEKSHRNSTMNPNAVYQQAFTLEEVMNSRMIADPITMYMCSANANGATAVVLASTEKAKQYTTNPVKLVGWAGAMPKFDPDDPEMEDCDVRWAAKKAYDMAGMGPKDMQVCQVHDAFSPGEILVVEKLGLCPEGEGGPFVWEGNTEITGKIPVNTDGGLVSCGHPIGATGCRMIAEISWQMRGMAGQRQIPTPPKAGILDNAGAGGGNIMIMKM
ncbi:MAG: thiolase family protein [Chloroflexota bacterium]|nr:thiolase family protein [Chloroflexota bacterium]